MKLIIAFINLVRWLNLLFIALTQLLFYYFIHLPIFQNNGIEPSLNYTLFGLLVTASVLIAAGGYIINDYFDLNIDKINKPHRIVVEKIIKRRWAILWHLTFSTTGILISFYIGWKINNLLLPVCNVLCVLLLWFYSTTFKKRLLVGNVIIALLSAWVVLVLYASEWQRYFYSPAGSKELEALSDLFKLAILYSGFAFIISLIREVIKDMEDMPGDAKYGCKTMPIIWGLNVAKVFIATWLIVLVCALAIVQAYVLQFRWWLAFAYCLVFILFPLLYIFKKLFPAQSGADFHQLSNVTKFVMLMGILSMIFFHVRT